MTIGQIKALIPAYLGEAAANLTVSTVDLRLQALNNARKQAEMIHDFTDMNSVARLSVGSSGGLLSAAVTEASGASLASTPIKTIQQIYLRDTNTTPTTYYPLFYDGKKTIANRILDQVNALTFNEEYLRYRNDNQLNIGADVTRVYQQGNTLYLNPSPTTTQSLAMDVNLWMAEYTADGDTDFMTTHGYTYLMWAAICELNKLTKTYVFRQEGFLSPPEKERDSALAALIQWDTFRSEYTFEGIR